MSFADRVKAAIRAWVRQLPEKGTLGRRLLIWYAATMAAGAALVGATLYFALIQQVNWVDDQLLQKRLDTITSLLETESQRDYWLNHEVSEDMDGPRRMYVRVLWPGGEIVAETPGMEWAAPVTMFPRRGPARPRLSTTLQNPVGNRMRVLVASAPWIEGAGSRPAIVQIAADTSLDDIVLARYRETLLLGLAAAIAIGVVIGVMQIMHLLSPLRRMADEVAKINPDALEGRMNTQGLTGELRRLAEQFNALTLRLARAYRGLRQYADNAAHELRTPLNKMLLGVDIALMSKRTPEEYQEALSQTAQDCRELTVMVDRLLFLARATNRQVALTLQQLDLRSELEAIREYHAPSAAEADVAIALDLDGDPSVAADRVLFQRAVNNLVANALAHTPAGGRITLCARDHGEGIAIAVRDSGEGIAAADLPHVFERFYRADGARSPGAHVGLGLAIVKSIVELHDGEVSLESTPGSGTTITIDLPRKQAPAQTIAAE